MPEPRNLTGDWVGHYYQNNRPSPISAALVHSGDRLSGSMTDGVTEKSSSLFDAASEAGLAPGADEQIEARLRELLPDAPAGPIRYVAHLPPASAVEGRVDGPRVAFVKTYEGTTFGGYQVGDTLVGHQTDRHSVHYQGTLAPDGHTIEGRWRIDADPSIGSLRAEGSFLLRRRPAPPGG